MTLKTDDDLRELFAPLAGDEPAPAEISRLRREAAARPRRRPRRMTVAALGTTTVAFALALALLPGAGDRDPTDPRRSVLDTAAAVAADHPVPPVSDAPLRYAKVLRTFSYPAIGDGDIPNHNEQVTETWVGARWRGREIAQQGRSWRDVDGVVREGYADPLVAARDQPYAYGDGPLAELDPADLPAERDAIARVLRDGIRFDRWGPYPESRGKDSGIPPQAEAFHVTYSIVGLLVYARLTPDQRAALIDVLATDRAARDLGTLEDRRGREGSAVELTYDDAAGPAGSRRARFRVIFDRRTSEILEWSVGAARPTPTDPAGRPVGTPDRTETVLATGYANAVGDRP